MSFDVANAVIPYTKEIPVDFKATVHSFFIGSYSPYEFTEWPLESLSWHDSCMIGDWSDIHKADLKGADVLPFMQSISGIKVDPYKIGQAKHVVCCNKRGKVIGEGILLRLSEDSYRMSGGPNFVEWAEYCFKKSGKWNMTFEISTDKYFCNQVQGPKAVEIMEAVLGVSLRDIPYMNFRTFEVCNASVQVLRQGMSGNIGFEIQGPSEKGVEIYNKILEVGADFGGVVRVGNAAKGVNHVEACFPTGTWDYTPAVFDEDDDFCREYWQGLGGIAYYMMGVASRKKGGSCERGAMEAQFSPIELGWGYSLCFDHEFPGSEILKEEKANPKRKICTLIWNDEDVADVNASYYRQGETYKNFVMPRDYEIAPDKVLKDGQQVGVSMSRAYSMYLKKMISLCVLDVNLLTEGTEVEVVWGYKGEPQKLIRAKVAPAPIFNPDKKRQL